MKKTKKKKKKREKLKKKQKKKNMKNIRFKTKNIETNNSSSIQFSNKRVTKMKNRERM